MTTWIRPITALIQWVVSGQLCVCWRGETGIMCALLPAVHWLHSMNVGAASGALHRPDYCLWAAHRAVLKPFIHLSAVLALETFPESFYSNSPFLIVIFQYMLTVQWVIMGGSICPHHLWDNLHVCVWVVNPLTAICLKQVSATVFMLI